MNRLEPEIVDYYDSEVVIVKPQIISGDFRRLFKAETPAAFCG